VACELSRRGAMVLPTTRNTKGFDLVCLNPDGREFFAVVQVKSSYARPGFFLAKAPPPDARENFFYAFVRLSTDAPKGRPALKALEAFVVSAPKVLETHDAGGAEGEWPSWSVPKSEEEQSKYLNRWDLILDCLHCV
jgi:hypothetical protein